MNVHFPTIPQAQLTQEFGRHNPKLYGTATPHHMGEDYGPMPGNPVFAPCDGLVIRADSTGKVGYGGQVRIQAPNGATVIVGHLSRWDVRKGQVVTAGQQIGLSGGDEKDPNSGHSSGAHIHFEYRPAGVNTDQGAVHPTNALLKFVSATLSPIEIISAIGMSVRAAPASSSPRIGGLPYRSTWNVQRIQNGWGLLDNLPGRQAEWVFIDNPKWVKVGASFERIPPGTPVAEAPAEPTSEPPPAEPQKTYEDGFLAGVEHVLGLVAAERAKLG